MRKQKGWWTDLINTYLWHFFAQIENINLNCCLINIDWTVRLLCCYILRQHALTNRLLPEVRQPSSCAGVCCTAHPLARLQHCRLPARWETERRLLKRWGSGDRLGGPPLLSASPPHELVFARRDLALLHLWEVNAEGTDSTQSTNLDLIRDFNLLPTPQCQLDPISNLMWQ